MKYKKGICWGGGIMLVSSILVSLLGPSPLILPLIPLATLSYLLGILVPVISSSLEGGLYGGGNPIVFVIWSTFLGVVVGIFIQYLLNKRKK